jgi:hypothetical protein
MLERRRVRGHPDAELIVGIGGPDWRESNRLDRWLRLVERLRDDIVIL